MIFYKLYKFYIMTQIVVTLEDGTNSNIIRSAINLIKGVKATVVTHIDTKTPSIKTEARLKAIDKLAGSISMDMIDTDDSRTQYLLNK